MDKRLTLSPDVVGLMWTDIGRLPDNLDDFNRDSLEDVRAHLAPDEAT